MDYAGNSDKSKEPDKKIEKVVTGSITQKEVSLGRKFKNVFFGGDARQTARYVTGDVLLPALRNLIVDVVTNGVERAVYGDAPRRRRGSIPVTSRVSYSSYSSPMRDPRDRPALLPDQRPRVTPRGLEREMIFERREDAENVMEGLATIVEQYEVASVGDLYELMGLPSTPINQKWGWTALGHMTIRQVREGYILDLPQPEEI